MTQKLKCFLERNNYKITAINTILIVTGITMGVLQRHDIEKKTDFSLRNQDLMIKADSEIIKINDSVQVHLRNKLDSLNKK